MTLLEFFVGYLAGVASSLHADAIGIYVEENLRRQRNVAPAVPENALGSSSGLSPAQELQAIAEKLSTPSAQTSGQDLAFITDLLTRPAFRSDLVTWLENWDFDDSAGVRSNLISQMAAHLTSRGVPAQSSIACATEIFERLDTQFFSIPAIAHWRHHIGLRALHEKIMELRDLAREQRGEFSEADQAQALQLYMESALKACDIIDLAGLPEEDRNLALKTIVLRQLYIPLRMRIESTSEEELSLARLDEIERRRRTANKSYHDLTGRDVGQQGAKAVSLGERLADQRKIVLLGDPGAGKTTLLRWIATAYLLRVRKDAELNELPDVKSLPDKPWLPLLVRCRDLDENALTGAFDHILAHSLVKSEIEPRAVEVLRAVIRAELASGRVILLIDGLDEITNPSLRARFSRQIEKISVAYESPVVVTSRIVGYREMRFRMAHGFEHATMAELTRGDQDEFSRRWCALTETPERQAKAASELIEAIHSSDRIERLARNPMLLTTIALVKRKIGRLPSRRAELYKEAVQVLLNWRAEIDEPLEIEEALPQLQYIAFAMCERGVQSLRRDDLLDLLDGVRRDYPNIRAIKRNSSEDFLTLLERRTGILIDAGFGTVSNTVQLMYEFRHLTFQEYLGARALVDGRYPGYSRDVSLSEKISEIVRTFREEEAAGEDAARENDAGGDVSVGSASNASDGDTPNLIRDSWREALRLCTTCCRDDDVDDVLLSILNPTSGEDAASTAYARSELTMLSLADEPNVSDAVAERIVEEFVTQAATDKALNSWDSDGTVEVVATSLWGDLLTRRLAIAYRACSSVAIRSEMGGLLGTAAWNSSLRDAESPEKAISRHLDAVRLNDLNQLATSLLAIMQGAFSAELHGSLNKDVVFLLTSKLDHPDRNIVFASAWALGWVSDRKNDEVADALHHEGPRVLAAIEACNDDEDITRWLTSVLGHSRYAEAQSVLRSLCTDARMVIREWALRALVRIFGDEIDLHMIEGFLLADWRPDPAAIITVELVANIAERLKRENEDIRARWERLATVAPLRLSWTMGQRARQRARVTR